MDKKTKKVIRVKISKLLDGKCQDCPFANQCDTCEVYKEIRHYANLIDGTKQPKRIVSDLTAKEYIKARNEGKSRVKIALEYSLTKKHIKSLVDKWTRKGEIKPGDIKNTVREKLEITERQYSEFHDKGYNDIEIAEMFGVSVKTLYNRKRLWKRNRDKVEVPTNFTKEMYLTMKQLELSDSAIARSLDVDARTVAYHKKKWGLVNV